MKLITNNYYKNQSNYLFEQYKLLCLEKSKQVNNKKLNEEDDDDDEYYHYQLHFIINNIERVRYNPFLLRKSSDDNIELIISTSNHISFDDSETYFRLFFPENDFINRIDLYWNFLIYLFNSEYFIKYQFPLLNYNEIEEYLDEINYVIRFISYYNNLPEYYNMIDLRNISNFNDLKIPNFNIKVINIDGLNHLNNEIDKKYLDIISLDIMTDKFKILNNYYILKDDYNYIIIEMFI